MTVRLHLIRHCAHGDLGQVLTGRSVGGSLSAAGHAQAARLGAGWQEPVAAIHASPRTRTRETAEAIAGPLGISVEIVDALDEVDFGHWTGERYDALDGRDDWREWNTHRATACPPGGEPMTAAVARIVRHLDSLAARSWDAALVCVSHCDMIRGAIAHYLGVSLDNLLRFDVDPGSVTTLSIAPWGGRLLSMNRTC